MDNRIIEILRKLFFLNLPYAAGNNIVLAIYEMRDTDENRNENCFMSKRPNRNVQTDLYWKGFFFNFGPFRFGKNAW